MPNRSKQLKFLDFVVLSGTSGYCGVAVSHPCQGWGRGFESLRPLQIVRARVAVGQERRSPAGGSNAAACRTKLIACNLPSRGLLGHDRRRSLSMGFALPALRPSREHGLRKAQTAAKPR